MHKVSFKQILDQNKQSSQQQGNLFTKLKQEIRTKSTTCQSIATQKHDQQLTLDTVLEQCQLQLQILKLEKANFIANQVIQFGICFEDVMSRVEKCIATDIQEIIKNKYVEKFKKFNKNHLQSTLHNTNGTQSVKKQSKKNSAAKNTLTPKIVQFTLGNRQASSARSNCSNKNGSEEVSQFFVGSKGAASKSIREKVMGPKKLK